MRVNVISVVEPSLPATGPGSRQSVASQLIDPLDPSSVTVYRDGNSVLGRLTGKLSNMASALAFMMCFTALP